MPTRRISTLTWALLAIAFVGADAHAGGRPDDSRRSWFGHLNAGYLFASGETADFLDDDWTIGGGAMYWPSAWPVGIKLDVNWWRMDMSSEAIQAINDAIQEDPNNTGQVTGGDFETWQFGLNAIWSLGADQSNGLYLTGGISYNDVTGRLLDTGLVYYPPVCNPWWWWCLPGGVGPGTFIRGEASSQEFGWNVGVGFGFADGAGFTELRYERIEFENTSLEYIPLTVGFRF